ncbi:PhzF family phenazine biosynthesis protein [Streptomyces sp. NRRL F-5123]|uniref:PhzF family phenazine biosynthesis protein n=1 Tax=Streptomyces sp. NRRL F-5123 TaxID=1463856 RepID=UPI00069332DE|nr:PhzF family phenazine biosynthesis protein [Streptomyces sp. NRRL F-5123]
MSSRWGVTVVRACGRGGPEGAGGSPTAVVAEREAAGAADAERAAVAPAAGVSHAVFVDSAPGRARLRFFTAEGELPACGHGTVAALAYLAARGNGRFQGELHAGGAAFAGRAEPDGAGYRAEFRTRPVELHAATPDEAAAVGDALGASIADGAVIASLGRARMLLPVAGRPALHALTPDPARLRAACDRLGLLGVYVHTPPSSDGRLAARMFAPSIGVPEDIANANSTACLAAHLAGRGVPRIAADMGDTLGSPATITAAAEPGPGPRHVRVGGRAVLAAGGRCHTLPLS